MNFLIFLKICIDINNNDRSSSSLPTEASKNLSAETSVKSKSSVLSTFFTKPAPKIEEDPHQTSPKPKRAPPKVVEKDDSSDNDDPSTTTEVQEKSTTETPQVNSSTLDQDLGDFPKSQFDRKSSTDSSSEDDGPDTYNVKVVIKPKEEAFKTASASDLQKFALGLKLPSTLPKPTRKRTTSTESSSSCRSEIPKQQKSALPENRPVSVNPVYFPPAEANFANFNQNTSRLASKESAKSEPVMSSPHSRKGAPLATSDSMSSMSSIGHMSQTGHARIGPTPNANMNTPSPLSKAILQNGKSILPVAVDICETLDVSIRAVDDSGREIVESKRVVGEIKISLSRNVCKTLLSDEFLDKRKTEDFRFCLNNCKVDKLQLNGVLTKEVPNMGNLNQKVEFIFFFRF